MHVNKKLIDREYVGDANRATLFLVDLIQLIKLVRVTFSSAIGDGAKARVKYNCHSTFLQAKIPTIGRPSSITKCTQ